MKKIKLLIVFIAFLGFYGNAQEVVPKYDYEPLYPDSVQYEIQTRVTQFLRTYHFKKFEMDSTLSSDVWDNYLKNIDSGKLYFTRSEVDNLDKYRYTVNGAMEEGNLDGAFEVFNLYRNKYKERSEFINHWLDQPIDYYTDLEINLDRENAEWAATEKELDDEWGKILLNQALSLKLTGKTDSAVVATLKGRYSMGEKRTSAYKSENVFNFFMNAFTEYIDPHTSYMIPIAADNFNISMSQSIEGIGATLTNEGEYVIIKSIVPGGPLFKSGKGMVDDYIVAVAQGEEGEFQDIVGWLTDDAIKLIRGKKGTVVQLKLLASTAPAGSEPRTVRLERDKIKIEDAVAKGNVINLKHEGNDYRIGIVDIPMFYRDFEGSRNGDDFQSTTADVRKILDGFREEGVDGVLIDLRNNGGGSLIEAIDLTGLFIKSGPVVQRKSSIGQGSVESDNDKTISYAGPLVVLQNRLSASASEIFAGAIQDYGRGLIVGENSFGKGTVQQLVDLDSYFARMQGRNRMVRAGSNGRIRAGISVNEPVRHGQLKFTSEKFYRITGNSTQIRGVVPDIELPSPFEEHERGEAEYETALPYDQVSAVKFEKVGDINQSVINKINSKVGVRLKTDDNLKELLFDIDEFKEQKKVKTLSLNYDVRKKELDELESSRNSIKKLNKSISEEGKEDDIYLLETEKILGDLIGLK